MNDWNGYPPDPKLLVTIEIPADTVPTIRNALRRSLQHELRWIEFMADQNAMWSGTWPESQFAAQKARIAHLEAAIAALSKES